jgi:hypothetical protein
VHPKRRPWRQPCRVDQIGCEVEDRCDLFIGSVSQNWEPRHPTCPRIRERGLTDLLGQGVLAKYSYAPRHHWYGASTVPMSSPPTGGGFASCCTYQGYVPS